MDIKQTRDKILEKIETFQRFFPKSFTRFMYDHSFCLKRRNKKYYISILPFANFSTSINKKYYEKHIEDFGGKVLDIGAGPGTGFFISKITKIESYFSFDISKKMLKRAMKESEKYSESRFYFVLGDGEYLPFKPRSFDAIICVGVQRHFNNIRNALKEVERVLKKHGKYFLH